MGRAKRKTQQYFIFDDLCGLGLYIFLTFPSTSSYFSFLWWNTYHFYNEKKVMFKFNKSRHVVLIVTSDWGNVGTKKGRRKVTSMVRGMGDKWTLPGLGIIQQFLKYTGMECTVSTVLGGEHNE